MNLTTQKIVLILCTMFLTSYLLTPIIRKIALKIGSVDKPNERRINKISMPTMGGLALYITFILGYILFGNKNPEMIPIILGSTVILITGIIDDIKQLSPKTKLLGQIIAAFILTLCGQILITKINAFGIYLEFGYLSYPLTIIFILAMTNAINLIDGLDGLASGVSSIFFLTITIIAVMLNMLTGLDIFLALIMLGATLGFLMHNFYPAKIYLGDSGALFLGYIISVIAIMGFKNVTLTSLIVPILILAIPIFDTLCAIARRIIKRESITKADKNHIHHQLLSKNISHRKTVLIIYAINILFATTSIVYLTKNRFLGIILYIILLLIVIWFITKTSILVDKKQSRKK